MKGGRGRASSRFSSSRWTDILIPAVLVLLLVILVGTILFVALFATGLL